LAEGQGDGSAIGLAEGLSYGIDVELLIGLEEGSLLGSLVGFAERDGDSETVGLERASMDTDVGEGEED
jgi:hypothetical protein